MGNPIPESRKLNVDPLTVTVTQIRQLTGLGPSNIYKLINDGTLSSFIVGGRRLVHYASVKKLVGLDGEPLLATPDAEWAKDTPNVRALRAKRAANAA